jgi:hypothetical protein
MPYFDSSGIVLDANPYQSMKDESIKLIEGNIELKSRNDMTNPQRSKENSQDYQASN